MRTCIAILPLLCQFFLTMGNSRGDDLVKDKKEQVAAIDLVKAANYKKEDAYQFYKLRDGHIVSFYLRGGLERGPLFQEEPFTWKDYFRSRSKYREISKLPKSIWNLSWLEELHLKDQKFKELPEGISRLKNLRILDLSETYLDHIPQEIFSLSQLESLTLSLGPLEVPLEITELKGLKSLTLKISPGGTLPGDFSRLTALDSLTLIWLEEKSFRGPFSYPPNLSFFKIQYLDSAQQRRDMSMPAFNKPMPRLAKVDLASNLLQSLPDTWDLAPNLDSLYVGGNELRDIPPSLAKCKHLHYLDFESNQLKILPEELCGLGELEYLGLGSNHLTQLPETIGKLHALKELMLDRNRLTALPQQFGKIHALEKLSLNSNKLSDLPESFSELKNLLNWI